MTMVEKKCKRYRLFIDLSKYDDDELDYIGDQFPDRLCELETAGKYIISSKMEGSELVVEATREVDAEEIKGLADKIAAEKEQDVEFEQKKGR